MPLRKEYPVYFTAKGLSDALDSTQTFSGACTKLQNLIFDPANPELLTSRPGVGSAVTSFSSFTTPSRVTIFKVIGSVMYGLVASARISSHDEPFAYNLLTNSFISIAGTLTANLPTTQSASGDWIPPTMAMVGTLLLFTHPGFSGSAQIGTCTASITGSVMTVTAGGTAASNGSLHIGANITGTDVPTGTAIIGFIQGSGTEGGVGQYLLDTTVGSPIASETITCASGNFFGVLDLSNAAAPVWFSTNTGSFPLPSVPNAVSNFNNRAYFACRNTAYYSDPLLPVSMGAAGQALTVGDSTFITALSGLPIQTTSAGVVGALVVFKGFQIWQITGDASITNSLSQNFLSITVGCNSPRSVVQTPIGIIFLGTDGPYIVTPLGQVSYLVNGQGSGMPDISVPFQNMVYPSRAAAAYSGFVYRVSVLPADYSSRVDYWFDLRTRRWSGPHTFGYDCADSYTNYFILTSDSAGAKVFNSTYLPTDNSVYLDNGTQITSSLTPSFLPKKQNPNIKQVVETTIELASPTDDSLFAISAYDEQYQLLSETTIITNADLFWGTTAQGGSDAEWGNIEQGGSNGTWASSVETSGTYAVAWDVPLVFKRITINISVSPSFGIQIGTLMLKYIDTGYTNSKGYP